MDSTKNDRVGQTAKIVNGLDHQTAMLSALRPLTSRVRTDATAIKTPHGGVRWTREPLTDDRLALHVNGGPARGVCPIKAGEDTTMVAVLDLDSHGGETPWATMVDTASQVTDALRVVGLEATAFRSSGGRGVHLYLLWDSPQDAASVREALRAVLAGCGLRDGSSGGVAGGAVEVFPKQDSVPLDGFGNQFFLPFAGRSAPLDLDLGIEVGASDVRWPVSEPVVRVVRAARVSSEQEGTEPLGKVRGALAAISTGDLDYSAWHKLMCSVHEATGGSDDGLQAMLEWGEAYSRHDERHVTREWARLKDSRSGGVVTRATLFGEAGKRGWSMVPAASPEGFTDVAVIKGEPEAEDGLPAFIRDKKGAIEVTIGNVVLGCGSAVSAGMHIAYDEFRDELMCAALKPVRRTASKAEAQPASHEVAGRESLGASQGTASLQWRPFRDADYTRLRIRLERLGWNGNIPKEFVRDAVDFTARSVSMDSAKVWLGGLPWDGVERVAGFMRRYLRTEDTEYARAVGLYLWTALAGRVMDPGCQCDMVPIFVGSQGAGKTSAVRALVPGPEFFCSVSFHEKDDALARKMRGKLVGEFGELGGFRTREIESIKDFVTRTHEEWIPKYREFANSFPRRLIFIGTANSRAILADSTGHRRWLPINVADDIDIAALRLDRPQLWAEARTLWAAVGVRWQDAYRLAPVEHDEFEVDDSWLDQVQHWLDGPDMDGSPVRNRPWLSTRVVMAEALRIEPGRSKKADEMRVGEILTKLGYEKRRVYDGPRLIRAWIRMEKTT